MGESQPLTYEKQIEKQENDDKILLEQARTILELINNLHHKPRVNTDIASPRPGGTFTVHGTTAVTKDLKKKQMSRSFVNNLRKRKPPPPKKKPHQNS